MSEENVFQKQIRLAACQVHGCIQDQLMVVRLGPLAKTLSGCLVDRVYALPHEGKRRESHGLPFSLEMQATILPRSDGMSHLRTDGSFRPGQAVAGAVGVSGGGGVSVDGAAVGASPVGGGSARGNWVGLGMAVGS